MHSGQNYRELRPTYAIWLLGEDLVRDDPAYAHRYRLRDERGHTLLEHGGVSLFELSKFAAGAVQTEEQRWLKFFKDGERLDADRLPDWMQTTEMRQAMSTLKRFSDKERAYDAYQARQNYLRIQGAIQQHQEELQQALAQERAAREAALRQMEAALGQMEAALRQIEAECLAKEAECYNGAEPRDCWLLAWERAAILAFAQAHPLDGYRRLAYQMLDADVVAVSPSSVYRVLKEAGWLQRAHHPEHQGPRLCPPRGAPCPLARRHRLPDIAGTFYYRCAVLDGYSRFIVHGEIRKQRQASDIEIILQRAREQVPTARPRIISDNAPQFIAKEFKTFIRLMGMTHVRTSPFYPPSNGKLERWHQSLKRECLGPKSPVSLGDARQLVAAYVTDYNTVRLHGAIGYITPQDQLLGRAETIFAVRRRKLAAAATRRAAAHEHPEASLTATPPTVFCSLGGGSGSDCGPNQRVPTR